MTANFETRFTYATPHGPVTLHATTRGLTEVVFGAEGDVSPAASAITNQAANELQEYLAGKRKLFETPLDPRGSAFQRAVWECVLEVPYGQTCTAADIAAALGRPGSHRSVGTAVRMCRLTPFIPCHRIMSASAAGRQPKVFRALMKLERSSL